MAIHEKLGELDHPSMAFTYDGLAIAYGEMSDFEKSLQFFLKANQIFRKYPGEEFVDYAISCDNVGVCYRKMNQLDQALVYSKKAVGFLKGASIKRKETHRNHHLAIAYSNLAAVYQIKGRLEKALTYHNKSLEIKKTIPNNDPLSIALSYSALGDVYRDLKEMDKALQFG